MAALQIFVYGPNWLATDAKACVAAGAEVSRSPAALLRMGCFTARPRLAAVALDGFLLLMMPCLMLGVQRAEHCASGVAGRCTRSRAPRMRCGELSIFDRPSCRAPGAKCGESATFGVRVPRDGHFGVSFPGGWVTNVARERTEGAVRQGN